MAQTITSTIVNINAIVTRAATPSQLQQSGALISVGGTSLATDAYQFCGDLATVESLLSAAGNHAELQNMATTFFAQGSAVGLYLLELGTGTVVDDEITALQTWITDNPGVFYAFLVPAAWDFSKDEVGSITITNGGTGYTAAPTVTVAPPTSGTTATATAAIANGVVISVTITNPGNGYTAAPSVTFSAPTSGKTATGTPNLASGLDILASDYASPTGKTYFFVTTVQANVANYSTQKSVIAMVSAPTANSSEFDAAAMFYQWLVNLPGAANKLAPMSYRYVYGVTPWVQSGNSVAINAILTTYGNLDRKSVV